MGCISMKSIRSSIISLVLVTVFFLHFGVSSFPAIFAQHDLDAKLVSCIPGFRDVRHLMINLFSLLKWSAVVIKKVKVFKSREIKRNVTS
jgi:hypothetical protein